MKKNICLLLTIVMALSLFTGCNNDPTSETTAPTETITESIAETAETTVPETEAPTEQTTVPEETEATTEDHTEQPTEATMETNAPECKHDYTSNVTSAATCTTDGVKTYTCKNCGSTYTEGIKGEHSYECTDTRPATCSNTGDKTYTCKICGHSYVETLPKNEHKWGEWKVTIEPTTTTYGKKVRTCELCYGSQEANIDPLPVDGTEPPATQDGSSTDCTKGMHNYVRIVDKEATCGDRGQYHSECSVCGERGMMDYLPETGNHTWGDWTAWEQSEYEMSRNRSCTVCGYTETETVITDSCEKNGHTISAADRAKIENWGDEYRILCICGECNAFGKTRDEALAVLNAHAAEKKYNDCGVILREGWGHRHYIPAYNCTVCGESRGNYSIWQECDGNCTACHVR